MDMLYIKSEIEALKKLVSRCSCGVVSQAIQERMKNVLSEVTKQ